jgi:hypothetical protein
MNRIARRLKRLEALDFQHRVEQGPSLAAIMLERRRKRYIAEGRQPEKGVRLQVPAFRPASPLDPGIAARLNAGRDLRWRQFLFDQCQTVSAELARAVTEQERVAAEARGAELELRCRKYGFASSRIFLQNCRDQGWLS